MSGGGEENQEGLAPQKPECCKEGHMHECPMHALPAKGLVAWKEPAPSFPPPHLKLKYILPNRVYLMNNV